MELQLNNPLQHHIADLLWKAKNIQQVKDIIAVYGRDATVVLEMMIAAYYDEVDSTDLAEQIIARVK